MAGTETALARATIINWEKPEISVECMFNPKEYSFSKTNSWKPSEVPATDVADLTFTSGKGASLQMQLFFDTVADRTDVRKKYTDPLWELMVIDKAKTDNKNKYGRPPVVLFKWGKSWSFKAVISSMKQQFTLFDTDGKPLRATVDVTFEQVEDPAHLAPQNPTSGGPGGERVWRVQESDTLAWIAYRSYGDTSKWRLIADANGLTRVRELKPGALLVIPND
jgi:hypothetical protein